MTSSRHPQELVQMLTSRFDFHKGIEVLAARDDSGRIVGKDEARCAIDDLSA